MISASKNTTKRKLNWKSLWFVSLPVSVLLVEVFGFFFLSYQADSFAAAQLWPLAFGVLWATLLGGILWLLPRLAARIAYGVFYFLGVLYAGFQTGYFFLFDKMMWLSDFRYASEGADYIDMLLTFPVGWWLALVGLLALGVVLLWKFPRWNRGKVSMAISASLAVVAVTAAISLPQLVFYFDYLALKETGIEANQLAGGDYGRMQSAEAAYDNMFSAHRLYKVCGLYQSFCKDLYTHTIYPLTPGYAYAQKQATEKIDSYLQANTSDSENEMTGLMEGKNVILVLMESMDDWMIGTHTPTISKLMSEGINFTQFYTPGYGSIRTFNTEFCINTGSYLSTQGGYAFDYVTNHFDQSLANQLRQQGYSAKTFHYNDPAFYSRGVFSLAMGYEEYVYYGDYIDPESDEMYDDCILFDNDELSSEFFREGQTFNFIITRSAHLSYRYGELLSRWGLGKYPQYRLITMDERVNCAYLKARLVDDMFARLLQALEEQGQLENTVIIGVTDHYTYGFRHSDGTTDTDKLMQLSKVNSQLLLEKTPCFIWSADLQPMEVSKTLQTADLLPTVLNLMGIDSRYQYLGRDAFDPDYVGYALFPDGSWISGDYMYCLQDGSWSLFDLQGQVAGTDAPWDSELSSLVYQFIESNNLILQTDYYKP